MSTALDPTDKSKMFGNKLDDLLLAVQEFELEDFEEQLHELAYAEFMSLEEHTKLYEWVHTDNRDPVPIEILAKCPHQYAMATLLYAMIQKGEQ